MSWGGGKHTARSVPGTLEARGGTPGGDAGVNDYGRRLEGYGVDDYGGLGEGPNGPYPPDDARVGGGGGGQRRVFSAGGGTGGVGGYHTRRERPPSLMQEVQAPTLHAKPKPNILHPTPYIRYPAP